MLLKLGEGMREQVGLVEGERREWGQGFGSYGYGKGEEGMVFNEGGEGIVKV
jgi:hypothetical protein